LVTKSYFNEGLNLPTVEAIGALKPNVVLYINNQPDWDTKRALDVKQLITENGNHWRKILTIFAKLCCDDDWRQYRDEKLLHHYEQINFGKDLEPTAKIHFFAGKNCWQRFAVSEENLKSMQLSPSGKVYYSRSVEHGLMLYTPYFDYRQFPNVLIADVKLLINNC